MLIASMKCRPWNQSAMILFCRTIIATAPTPAMLRPMPIPAGPADAALIIGPEHHEAEAGAQHKAIAEPPAQQPDRDCGEAAQQHERADQGAERRVVEMEQAYQFGAERRHGLKLVAEADAAKCQRGKNEPGSGAHVTKSPSPLAGASRGAPLAPAASP